MAKLIRKCKFQWLVSKISFILYIISKSHHAHMHKHTLSLSPPPSIPSLWQRTDFKEIYDSVQSFAFSGLEWKRAGLFACQLICVNYKTRGWWTGLRYSTYFPEATKQLLFDSIREVKNYTELDPKAKWHIKKFLIIYPFSFCKNPNNTPVPPKQNDNIIARGRKM